MTAELLPQFSPPSEWKFKDRTGMTRPFTGWFIDSVSTERESVPRWTEMEVYRRTDGAYVLRVLGCSIVYHRQDSVCNTGEPMLGKDMDADMVPCKRCEPENYLAPDMDEVLFNVEVEVPSLQLAKTPAELVQAMREDRNGAKGELSYPAHRLLRKLKAKEPAIAAELSKSAPL